MPVVAECAIDRGRIDVVPVDVEQLLVARLLRIESDFDRLRMTCAALFNLLVARMLLGSAGISGLSFDHAWNRVEGALHRPEASAGEGGLLEARRRCVGGVCWIREGKHHQY